MEYLLAVTIMYIKRVLIMLALLGGLWIFWGEYALFTIGDLWIVNDNLVEGLASVWFIFAWAIAATLVICVIYTVKGEMRYQKDMVGGIFLLGGWISLNAGVFEELEYRWLRFSVLMITLPFINWLLFGFIPGQMGLLHWLYEYWLLPIADLMTLGALHDFLFYPASWVVGAAIVSANGKFREAHQGGTFNMINAWFIGMVMFCLMFTYGLLAAIIAHALYDMLIFATIALVQSLQKKPFYGAKKKPAFRA